MALRAPRAPATRVGGGNPANPRRRGPPRGPHPGEKSINYHPIMYSVLKSTLLLSVVIGLAQCTEDQCPSPADLHPCTCSEYSSGLYVSCNGVGDFYDSSAAKAAQDAIKRLSGKKINALIVSGYNLGLASSDLFNGIALRRVYLSNTNIDGMPAFEGSENTLEKLEFHNAVYEISIRNFTSQVSHLNNLKFFSFVDNYYDDHRLQDYKTISVGNDWFKSGPSSLEDVIIFDNKVKSVGDTAFAELVNLKDIDLSFNRIEEIHRSMFPDPAKHLLAIRLWSNKLKSLPEDIFSNMPELETVNIQENKISVLDELTWRPVWEQLESLTFGADFKSPITCDKGIFWTFNLNRPKYLEGVCSRASKTDQEFRGRRLSSIIDEKQG